MNCFVRHPHQLSNNRHSKYSNATTTTTTTTNNNNNDIDKDVFYPFENICPDDSDLSFKQNGNIRKASGTNGHRRYSHQQQQQQQLQNHQLFPSSSSPPQLLPSPSNLIQKNEQSQKNQTTLYNINQRDQETMNSIDLHRYYSRRTPMRAYLNQFKILSHYYHNDNKRLQNRLVLPNQTCKLSSDTKQQHQQQQEQQQSLRNYRSNRSNRVLRILHDKNRIKFYEERELIKKFSDVEHIDDDDDGDGDDDGGYDESNEKDEYYYYYHHQQNEADTVSIEAVVTKDNNDNGDEDVDVDDGGICDKNVGHGENSVYVKPVNEYNLNDISYQEYNRSEEHAPGRNNEETVKWCNCHLIEDNK
ncbi:unnamed protein product [Trichobilharzia regenti]|uniref:Homeobox protein 2-like n=1 Tax=Trichobilharzia regenti TaxID=157069 RepID=A0A183VVZ6_TRIRE|nr:unnamed protein product [Trichobilharzia regenti]VDQ00532.1 unnamed protein product [Trichobilharzia regenti]